MFSCNYCSSKEKNIKEKNLEKKVSFNSMGCQDPRKTIFKKL
jgi:hypothetical protein